MPPVLFDYRSHRDEARGDAGLAAGSGHPERRSGIQRSILTLLFLSSLTFFLGLGRQAITDSDEGFYAEAAREMVESGDWITPHFNYEERWQKPALYYWLTAATYRLTGPTELGARWWSALSGVGLVILTWAIARRLTGGAGGRDQRRFAGPNQPGPRDVDIPLADGTAWLAGAIVATTFGCFALARLALPDLPLAFLITLTIWSALEERWLLAGAAAALGFLMKGPLAVLIPGIVLVPVWWRERRLVTLPWRNLTLAALVFLLIAVPWYAAMTVRHGTPYLESFFVGDNFERFATDRFNEPRPLWFYLPIVAGGMLPWSMFLLVLPWPSVRDVFRRTRRLTRDELRLLVWVFVPFLFFTISIGKQPRYILPLLPPLGILLARSIGWRATSATHRAHVPLAIATWATAVLYGALAVLLVRAEPLFITTARILTYVGIVLVATSAVALAWIALSRQWRALPVTMAASAVVVLLALQFGALAGRRPEPVEQMASLIATHRQAGEPVGVYNVFVRSLVFYTRSKQVDLFDEGRALDFLKSPERVLLVVRAGDLQRLETIAGVTAKRLGEMQYLNAANFRLRTLLAPLPDQDIERVLLVANK